jgi:hypothetical protein
VQFVDHQRWGSSGRGQHLPGRGVETRQGLSDRGYLGRGGDALACGDTQRAHFTALDLHQHRRRVGEQHLNMTGY